jgi:hypothetical protein
MDRHGAFLSYKRARIAVLLAFAFVLAANGCNHTTTSIKGVYTPAEWASLLKQAGDWVPLPYPESVFSPGSIIMVTETSIRWIDHLSSCRYPTEILQPEKSRMPNVSFAKSMDFGADAVIGYKGIEAGPGFSRVGKTNLEVLDHGVEYLRIIKLQDWMNDPANKKRVSPTCMQELAKPNRYLVTEAFTASKAAYTLYDKTGAVLKLDVPLLKTLLNVSGNVKYDIDATGKLVIDQPVYFAVRRVIRMADGGFEPRDPEPAADAKIEKVFFRSTPKQAGQ